MTVVTVVTEVTVGGGRGGGPMRGQDLIMWSEGNERPQKNCMGRGQTDRKTDIYINWCRDYERISLRANSLKTKNSNCDKTQELKLWQNLTTKKTWQFFVCKKQFDTLTSDDMFLRPSFAISGCFAHEELRYRPKTRQICRKVENRLGAVAVLEPGFNTSVRHTREQVCGVLLRNVNKCFKMLFSGGF